MSPIWIRFTLILTLTFLSGTGAQAAANGDFLRGQSLDGRPVSLEALRGKVVMVGFWATWCPVCRTEMPVWQRLYQRLKGSGLEILAVSLDEAEAPVRQRQAEAGFSFPLLWRFDDAMDDSFGDVTGTPTVYLIDRRGARARVLRGRVPEPALEDMLRTLLDRPEGEGQ